MTATTAIPAICGLMCPSHALDLTRTVLLNSLRVSRAASRYYRLCSDALANEPDPPPWSAAACQWLLLQDAGPGTAAARDDAAMIHCHEQS